MSEGTDRSGDIWDFIPVDEYTVPGDSMSVGTVHKGFRAWIRRLSGKDQRSESPLDPDEDLHSPSGPLRTAALPRPDWSPAAATLDERLRPWLHAEKPAKPVVSYVAPPYSGGKDILTAWAAARDIPSVRIPEVHEIIGDREEWFRQWPRDTPWVLPHLEKCFIRRADGLDLVRDLLSRLLAGEFGQGVVGCDGWGWRFLQHVWLGRPSYTITARALDGDAMRLLFGQSLAVGSHETGQGPGPFLTFRQSDDGTYLFPPGDAAGRSVVSPAFWRHLAAYSRGNAGVASACWERALRTVPEDDLDGDVSPSQQERNPTVWVTPWGDLEVPVLPGDTGELSLFVLHALLIHNGLDADTLAEILPTDRTGVIETLLFLREAEVVHDHDGEWRVAPAGYPAVRKALDANDYMCDPF